MYNVMYGTKLENQQILFQDVEYMEKYTEMLKNNATDPLFQKVMYVVRKAFAYALNDIIVQRDNGKMIQETHFYTRINEYFRTAVHFDNTNKKLNIQDPKHVYHFAFYEFVAHLNAVNLELNDVKVVDYGKDIYFKTKTKG